MDLPGGFKQRPSLDESPAYLVGWLAGYFAADGCVAKDGTVMLNSASREDLEFVRLLGLRVGIGTYGVTEQLRQGLPGRALSSIFRIHFINEDLTEDFFLLREHRARFVARRRSGRDVGGSSASVEPTDRVEEVYCAFVPGEHAFALEDNILTGNCFGCDAGGDAITFVREVEHLDFVDAVERLAARAGITLRYDDKNVAKDRTRKQRLSEAVAAAIAFYHELLLGRPNARIGAPVPARSRGSTATRCGSSSSGARPTTGTGSSVHLQQKKFARDDIVRAPGSRS